MKKTLKTLCVIPALVAAALALTVSGAYAADRNSVKMTGEYHSRSVYGPSLSSGELDDVADAVAAFLNEYIVEGMTDQQKVRAACGFISTTCTYAESWAQNRANTAWGSLVYHEAQCSGYARGFKALCDGMGIGCFYVHADDYSRNPDHQWNVVCIDGNWYIIDTQSISSSGIAGVIFSYLVSDDDYLSSGLSWDRSSVPACPEAYYKREDRLTSFMNDIIQYIISDTEEIFVNGQPKTVTVYNISGNNYIKLRDIAAMTDGTGDSFNVVPDIVNGILWIDTKTPYTFVGGELNAQADVKGVLNPVNMSSFRVDGIEYAPKGYNIRNNNYYKLRDIGEIIGFDVDWNGSNVIITTK
ncbi:MAG: hypothetical protein J1F64_10300 [Oscillospiraceae bacterium]|nr:hypothetical protein [Oscillospiraceae bacterium]